MDTQTTNILHATFRSKSSEPKFRFREGKQIIEACKDGTLVDYFQFWNIIDIVCVLVSNMIFIVWILQTLTLGTAGSQILEAFAASCLNPQRYFLQVRCM